MIKNENKQKIICRFDALCDVYDTFNWYFNRFHLLLKKPETSYNNTRSKSNWNFINHSNCCSTRRTQHKKVILKYIFKIKNHYLFGGHPLHSKSKKSDLNKKSDFFVKIIIFINPVCRLEHLLCTVQCKNTVPIRIENNFVETFNEKMYTIWWRIWSPDIGILNNFQKIFNNNALCKKVTKFQSGWFRLQCPKSRKCKRRC